MQRRWPPHLDWVHAPEAGPTLSLARDDDDDLTGAYTWPAGLALSYDLALLHTCCDQRVLDLGCGQGILGLTALGLSAQHVVFTDGSLVVCDFITRTLTLNALTNRATISHMNWGSAPAHGPFQLILGGDLLYRAANIPALAATIKQGLATQGTCLLSDPRRTIDSDLVDIFANVGLNCAISRRDSYSLIQCNHR